MHLSSRRLRCTAFVLAGGWLACSLPASGATNGPLQASTLFVMKILPGHQPRDIYTPVTHARGHTYFVQPDVNDRPTVMHHAGGRVETVFLDDRPDYKAFPDGHNGFSIGVDEAGYVHVAGDMHQFGAGHGRDGRYPYPERYNDQRGAKMLYWRSRQPWDLSAGFDFLGAANQPPPLPGTSWSYGRFFNDARGVLHYSARVRAFIAKDYRVPTASQGSMGLGLYRYDAAKRTWIALGAPPDHPDPGNVARAFPVLYWAHSGRADTKQSYQVYQGHFAFDASNRLHLAVSGQVGPDNLSRVLYARSDDGGRSWCRIDGSPIPGLPLRGEAGHPNVGSVVSEGRGTYITKVVADRHGRVAVKHGVGAGWLLAQGDRWTHLPRQPGTAAYVRPDGSLLFTAEWGVWSAEDLSQAPVSCGRGILVPSQPGLLSTGNVFGLAMNKEKTQVSVMALSRPIGP